MKVVISPDSFKGSISAKDAAAAIARGVRQASSEADIIEAPVADGGEGTVEALVAATGGTFVDISAKGPLGRDVTARYGMIHDGATAVIEMAAASGLTLVPPDERDPMAATTYGTGQLILDAASRGATDAIVGIGGSATVDGGAGMARALGVKFLDEDGRELTGGGAILKRIRRIDMSGIDKRAKTMRFTVAADVTNPLTGPSGAAAVYGPQKGATPEMVRELDEGLSNLAAVIKRDIGMDVGTLAAAGAAGGLGAGLAAFLAAKMASGIDIVLDAIDFDEKAAGADLVITGEGSIDGQSASGKAVSGVAMRAARAGAACIVLAGHVGEGAERMLDGGVSAIFSIARGPAEQADMMRDAAALLEWAGEQAVRAFTAGMSAGGGAL